MNGDYGSVTGKDIPVDRRFVRANMNTDIVHHVDKIEYGAAFTVCGRMFLHPHRFLHRDHPGIDIGFLLCLQCQSGMDASLASGSPPEK